MGRHGGSAATSCATTMRIEEAKDVQNSTLGAYCRVIIMAITWYKAEGLWDETDDETDERKQ